LAICYDMRFPELATIAARLGAGAMIYPGAFNTTTGPRHWELLQRCRAMDNQLYVAACSPARATEEEIKKGAYPAWGHSTITDPWAYVKATMEEQEGILRWKLEPSEVEEVRKGIPINRQSEYKSNEALRRAASTVEVSS
jgi:omega-amidase